jgi:hypothetical protein
MDCLLLNMEVTQSYKTPEQTYPVTCYHGPDELGPQISQSNHNYKKKYSSNCVVSW